MDNIFSELVCGGFCVGFFLRPVPEEKRNGIIYG